MSESFSSILHLTCPSCSHCNTQAVPGATVELFERCWTAGTTHFRTIS